MIEYYCKVNETPQRQITNRDIAIRAIEAYLTRNPKRERHAIAEKILFALERVDFFSRGKGEMNENIGI